MRVLVAERECAEGILREWLIACNKSLHRVSAHLTWAIEKGCRQLEDIRQPFCFYRLGDAFLLEFTPHSSLSISTVVASNFKIWLLGGRHEKNLHKSVNTQPLLSPKC